MDAGPAWTREMLTMREARIREFRSGRMTGDELKGWLSALEMMNDLPRMYQQEGQDIERTAAERH